MTTTHPELPRLYSLDATARRRFEGQGFAKLPGVLSPGTVRSYEPDITSRVIELNTRHLLLAERDTSGKAFLQVTNLWQHSEVVRDFVFSTRPAGVAAELLGVDAVRLYHDQALCKEAGGGITP